MVPPGEPLRRGFDHAAFESHLQSLWFQRKALLADGRTGDAAHQAALMRAFCEEEDVGRMELMAGALIAEASRRIEDGRFDEALESLALAAEFDPGRPQTHVLRAAVYWRSGRGYLEAGRELLAGARAAFERGAWDLTLFGNLALLLVVAGLAAGAVFSLLMVARYGVPLRHEVEEWLGPSAGERGARWAGWALLGLPLLLWFAAGWAPLYWIAATFRYMRSSERSVAVLLLLATALSAPALDTAVGVYAVTADPVVRTTLAAARGEYSPELVLRVQRLVEAHPEDASYRFLLAGLYRNGRYFEEAFSGYQAALAVDPSLSEAHVNVGNLFFSTGQYGEAIASYRRALELDPRSLLGHFNSHLAQSQLFRFKEAEESLAQARVIDPSAVAALLERAGQPAGRPAAPDAELARTSVWSAAFEGRGPEGLVSNAVGRESRVAALVHPVSVFSGLALLAGLVAALSARRQAPARRCIRCGRPFCACCKSSRDGHEYCSQCYHLYVLGDGLSPEAKTHKMYEVARYDRRQHLARRVLSAVLPGAGHVLRDRPLCGAALTAAWILLLSAWRPDFVERAAGWVGIELGLALLAPAEVPVTWNPEPQTLLAVPLLVLVWITGNVGWRRNREA